MAESVDGKIDTIIVVKSSNKICEGMKPTDWVTMKVSSRMLFIPQWNQKNSWILPSDAFGI